MGKLTISMAIFNSYEKRPKQHSLNEAGGGVPRATCLGAGGWSGLGEGDEVALFLWVKCHPMDPKRLGQ